MLNGTKRLLTELRLESKFRIILTLVANLTRELRASSLLGRRFFVALKILFFLNSLCCHKAEMNHR